MTMPRRDFRGRLAAWTQLGLPPQGESLRPREETCSFAAAKFKRSGGPCEPNPTPLPFSGMNSTPAFSKASCSNVRLLSRTSPPFSNARIVKALRPVTFLGRLRPVKKRTRSPALSRCDHSRHVAATRSFGNLGLEIVKC